MIDLDALEKARTTGERAEALRLADVVLDRPWADPDDDLATLSRQLKRAFEREDALIAELRAARAVVAETAALRAKLLPRLEHGDDAHRTWLRDEIAFLGSPVDRALAAYDAAVGREAPP